MKKLTLITSLIISFNLYAQPFSLVKEINTTATNSSFSSSLMQRVGTTVYFIANDGINGNELWKSDGTNAGTVMVKDITPGSGNTLFINFTAGDGLLFFTANDGVNGYELWRTDGTDAGTFIVRDGFSECTFCLNRYFFHNGFLYFAGDDGTGAELWKTDGTTAGTVLVKDIFPGPTTSHPAPTSNVNYTFVALGNDVYFSAVDAAGGRELFKTDGTEGGTVMVKDIFPGATSSISTVNHKAAVFNGKVYFAANDGTNGVELWATDGTEAGTYLVKDIVAGSGSAQPNNLIAYNGALYFTASTTNNAAPDLYKTDGTEAGTVLVKNLVADGITLTIGNSSGIDQFTIANNKLFFRGNGPSGFELYATDGTTDGTGLAKDLYPGVNGVNPNGLLSFNNNLYFHGIDFGLPSRGGALYKSDGSAAGTEILTDAIGGLVGAASAAFASANGRLFFYGNTNDHGTELWSTDGTSANTNLVKDINATKIGTPNSGAFFLGSTVFNGYYYYAAVDDSHGNELWKSDGTTAGTMMVKDIWPGKAPSNPAQFFVFNGALYFTASDGVTGTEIWKTDGTQAGTFLVKDINPGPVNSGPNRFGIAGNFLYFMAYHSSYGTELWRSDGTAAGTSMVIDLIPGAANGVFGIQDVVTLGTNAYLILSIASGNVLGIPVGNRIIKIDGLTNTVTDFAPVVTSGTDLGLVGSTLYISGRNAAGNTILWKSENGGAVTQVKILSTTATNAYQLTNCGGKLYFNASNGTAAGSEPWISDGTDAGTYMLKDINPGINPSTPHQFVLSGDKVYFTASSTGISNSDHELWATDGTEAGTYLVKDIQPGINGSRPNATISAYGNKVLFTANDGTTGYELWESDGTAAGTFLKQEFNTSGDGIPLTNIFINFNTDFVYSKLNDKILFFARSADKGLQLYSGSIASQYIYVNDNSLVADVFTTAIGNDANTGTALSPFATITKALSVANEGDIIYVDAGTYIENVIVNKSVTLRGVKYGQQPGSSLDRGNETIIIPAVTNLALIGGSIIRAAADNITIDGFMLDGDNPNLVSGTLVNGVDVNAGTAIFNDNIVAAYLTVKNNIVKNTGTYGIGLFRTIGTTTGPVVPGALFTQNRVDNIGLRGIVLAYSAYGSITNNYITRCTNSGTWFSQQNVANINNEPGVVSGNYIEVRSLAMQSSSLGVNASAVHYLNNEIKGTGNTTGLSLNLGNPGGAVIANNKFADVVTGVSVSSSVAGAPVLVNNNSFTNIGTKIIASFTANMVSATCNWLDGTNGEMIASKMTGNINYIPWLTDGTDTDPVARGFQPQAGVCTGRPTRLYVNDNDQTGDVFTTAVGNDANSGLRAFPFATINYALTQAQAGDTIFVDAGTYISGGTISKAITILGTNYLISPNDATDPLLPNAGRNAESIINSSTFTIGASNINCSGLTFNPGSVSQFLQTNNSLDFSNIDISKNRFIINSNVILISLTGRNISPLSTNNYTISNNRFEKTSGTAGNCMQLNYINNVGITANVFTPASASMSRVQSSVSMGPIGKIDNLTISNNIFDRSNISISSTRLGASLIENNKCYNVGAGFGLVNTALEPATVTVRGNYLSNGNGAISYLRNNTTDISAPNKFICEDNVVNVLVVTDGPAFPAGVLIASTGPSSVLSANVIMETEIRRNIFNYSGDLGQIANISPGGIRISNRHTGLVIENNEVNLNVVNNTSPNSIPPSGIVVFHNNSVNSAFSSSAVINIRNNKISNFKQSIIFYDVIGQRYGGLATGMTVNINENRFTGDSVSINNGTISKTVNATCNWYGSAAAQTVITKFSPSTVNYIPWLSNGADNDIGTGFQPVPGSCTGTPVTAVLTQVNNVTCFGAANGSINVTISSGVTPYTFAWSKDAVAGYSSAEDLMNLSPGVYDLLVTDANGSTETLSANITQPTLIVPAITDNSTACSNIATVTTVGGTPVYSYLWSNGSTSATISSVPVGIYNVTITDANGCTATASISLTVSQAFNPSVSVTDVSCFGTATGSVTITNANGTAPFTFSIDGINFVPGAFPHTFNNLPAGTYSVAVRDVNGCTGFNTKTVSQPTALVATLGTVQSTCAGASTGSINVSVSGGTTAYSYSWTRAGGGFSSSQLNISGLATGSYTLTVTDKNGCTRIVNATVPAYPSITVTSIVTNILCKGETNGSIDLTVSGGTSSGFSYLWNSGATTEDRFNLGTGNYTVTITDIGSGCTESRSFTITQPATAINLSAGKSNVLGCNSLGTVTASGSGGTAPFQYSLNGGAYQSSGSFTGLYAGNYTVTVRDANGCTKSSAILNIADNGTDEYESNNSKNKASQINVGIVINARIATTGDPADWFWFTTTNAGVYVIELSHPSAMFAVDLYPSSNGAALVPQSSTASTKTYTLSVNTTYFISVTGGLSYSCYNLSIMAAVASRNPELIVENKILDVQHFNVKVFNNPTDNQFGLRVETSGKEKINIKVVDVNGRIVERKENIADYQLIEFGAKYMRGIYFAEITQGEKKQIIKLIKL